jgi:hypothetical protein
MANKHRVYRDGACVAAVEELLRRAARDPESQRAKVRLNCAVDPKQGFGGASGLRPADTSPPTGLKRRFVKAIERPYQLCAGFALIICPTRLRRLRTERAGGPRTART